MIPAGLRSGLRHLLDRAVAGFCVSANPLENRGRPIVAGFFRTPSGLGKSARLSADALQALGLKPYRLDLSARYLPHDLLAPATAADIGPLPASGPMILHVNPPELPSVVSHIGRRALAGRLIVGYWAWELPQMPRNWMFALRLVHEIWVPSRFCADAIRPHTTKPVRVVPHPLTASVAASDRVGFGLPISAFIALSAADLRSSLARKNPLAAVAAFRQAFGDSEEHVLVLKIGGTKGNAESWKALQEAIEGLRNVRLISEVLAPDRMASLIASCDIVLSLHRSEGFGLVIAQGMQAGVPAIATDWSGSTDFLDESCGVPVPTRLVPVDDPQGRYGGAGQVWAEPDVAAAAEALRRLSSNPAWRRQLGEAARRRIDETLSSASYKKTLGRSFLSRLEGD